MSSLISDNDAPGSKSRRHPWLSLLLVPYRSLVKELTENVQASEQVEHLWLIGRMAVAIVGIVAAVLVLNGTISAAVIYIGGGVVIFANSLLFFLLRRGKTLTVAIAGLLVDNLVLLAVWTSSLGFDGETKPTNDLYLGFFPVFSLWTSRLGLKLGAPYTVLWMIWITWTVYAFLPAGSYEVEQHPIRIAFLTLTSMLGLWTAKLVRSQATTVRESSLRAMELQELDTAKDRFIATVSHELKTPMAVILGFTRILRKGTRDDKQLKRLAIIERNGNQLSLLIDDLLDLSQIQRGTLSFTMEPMEVSEFVSNTVSDLKSVVQARDQVITLDAPDTPYWITGDATRFAQVLTNLITNASKYSPGESTISVRSKVEAGSLILSVSDEGDGISAEDQLSLFQAFYRTESAEKSTVQGTGLGLFISRRIVEIHGGELTLESKQGAGTTVTMKLYNVTSTRPVETDGQGSSTNPFDELEEAS